MEKKITIPKDWEIPAAISVRVAEVPGTQRCLEAEGHMILILHKLPSTDSARRDLSLFWRKPEGTWKSDGFGHGLMALRQHVIEFNEKVMKLEVEENEAVSAEDYFQIRREISPIYRAAQHMLVTISRAYDLFPEDRDLLICRNLASTAVRTAELLKEDATHGLEYFMAKQAESQALASHRLNLIAAIFFPILAFASIFGMNLSHGYEDESPWLFWLVVIIGITTGWVMKSLVFKVSKKQTVVNSRGK